MLNLLTREYKHKKKENFHPTDSLKASIDLWLAFNNVQVTNPPTWYDTVKFGAGKGAELELLDVLKESKLVHPDYDQEKDGRIEKTYPNGVVLTGYVDAISMKGNPIEIKTINNKNKFDIEKYSNGLPRENYVGQLSFYMDVLGKDRGALLVVSIDGLHRFWIENRRIGDGLYKCGNIVFDLNAELKRWEYIYSKKDEPTVPEDILWEYTYKRDIKTLNWDSISASEISKARNGHKVIGDWQIQYSNYKDKIIELQGETIGYTNEELEYIKSKTKGYTKK